MPYSGEKVMARVQLDAGKGVIVDFDATGKRWLEISHNGLTGAEAIVSVQLCEDTDQLPTGQTEDLLVELAFQPFATGLIAFEEFSADHLGFMVDCEAALPGSDVHRDWLLGQG